MLLLQINKEDILPKNLCQHCLSDLTFTYEFIEKCRKSEEILRISLISSENATESIFSDNEIKIEESNLSSDSEMKAKVTIVKRETDFNLIEVEEENSTCNFYSNCKYYLLYYFI